MRYKDELDAAIEAVELAARICRSVQKDLSGSALKKDDRSPVTVADFGSQAVICRSLQQAFPDDPVIAEEDSEALRNPGNEEVLNQVVAQVRSITGDADVEETCGWIDRGNAADYSERFWTLDPIDGTKGFLRGDQYAVALALIIEGDVQVAALACPNLSNEAGITFAAHRGEGSFLVSPSGKRERISASPVTDPSNARFCESVESSHSSHKDAAALADRLGITKDPFRIDSQAKYGVVARGDADIYLRLTTRTGYVENIWDHAAGALVVEESGGRVTDLNGRPLDFSRGTKLDQNVGIVATNGHLHDAVLSTLDAVLAPS